MDEDLRCVGFSHNGALAASGSYDGCVKIWRAADGVLQRTLEGPGEIEWLQWHPRGDVTHRARAFFLQSLARERVRNSTREALDHTWAPHSGGGIEYGALFGGSTENRSRCCVGEGRCVGRARGLARRHLLDVAGQVSTTRLVHSERVPNRAKYGRLGLATRGEAKKKKNHHFDPYVRRSGECMRVFAGHDGPITCGLFTSDGHTVVTGSADGTVRVWAPKKGTGQR